MKHEVVKMSVEDREEIQNYLIPRVGGSFLYFHKRKYYEGVVSHILKYTKRSVSVECSVRWLVSNSARCINNKNIGFKVYLDSNLYTKNKLGIGYRNTRELLDILEVEGYIDIYTGGVKVWCPITGTPIEKYGSFIVFKDKFYDMWGSCVNTRTEYKAKEWRGVEEKCSVEINKRGTSEGMNMQGVKTIEQIRSEVDNINQHLKGFNITLRGEVIPAPFYIRKFIDSIDLGGRLYVDGGGVQMLPQHVRLKHLKFNGEEVVELDFSAIMPNTMSEQINLLGGELDERHNPYGAKIDFVSGCAEQKRDLIKKSLLIAFNARNKHTAIAALRKDVADEGRKSYGKYNTLRNIDVVKVFDAVCEHNAHLKDFFFCDRGVELQRVDSDIIVHAATKLMEAGECFLLYHDSVIVRVGAKDVCIEYMRDAWRYVLGDNKFCRIKEVVL